MKKKSIIILILLALIIIIGGYVLLSIFRSNIENQTEKTDYEDLEINFRNILEKQYPEFKNFENQNSFAGRKDENGKKYWHDRDFREMDPEESRISMQELKQSANHVQSHYKVESLEDYCDRYGRNH